MSGNSLETLRRLGCWKGMPEAVPLTGGLSNESWKVTDGAGVHVARFGRDFPVHHVDRAREAMCARAAHKAGFGPEVEFTSPGVMVSAYIEARTWQGDDVRQQAARVGGLLARFHRDMARHVEGTGVIFWPFHVLRDYARTLRAADSAFLPDVPELLALGEAMEDVQLPLPIVLGHHDLLPANFLDDGSRLWLIDFEYAAFGTAMFDLAGAAANAVMDDHEASILLESYFGRAIDEGTWRAFDAMQVTALVREAMWAMVSDIHLAAPGADYKAYATENLGKLEGLVQRYQEKHGKWKA